MNNWIIPCNPKFYNIHGEVKESKSIIFNQTRDFKVDDNVLIYISDNEKRINYVCKVEEVNLVNESIQDDKFVLDKKYFSQKELKRYMKIKIKENIVGEILNFTKLKELGLKGNLRSQTKISDELYKKIINLSEIYHLRLLEKIEYDFINYCKFENIKKIKQLISKRIKIVNYFNLKKINNMSIDEYVTGKENQKSFCYELETSLKELGSMKGGSTADKKFGVYYSYKNKKYINIKKWGDNHSEAFVNIKDEIIKLLDYGGKMDFYNISKNKISPMFKGKILSTYYPEKYLGIMSENHTDYLLEEISINFSYKTPLFIKKNFILELKNKSKCLKETSNEEYIDFLYDIYRKKSKENVSYKNGDKKTFFTEKINVLDFKSLEPIKKNQTSIKANRPLVNFEEKTINNNRVGEAGEILILDYEEEKLSELRIKKTPERISLKDQSAGYDILSYERDGKKIKKIKIEVKTKSNMKYENASLDFFISSNELDKLRNDDDFYIYYVFYSRDRKPNLIILDNKDLSKSSFEPVNYRVKKIINF